MKKTGSLTGIALGISVGVAAGGEAGGAAGAAAALVHALVRRITKRKEHQHQQGQGNNAHLEQVQEQATTTTPQHKHCWWHQLAIRQWRPAVQMPQREARGKTGSNWRPRGHPRGKANNNLSGKAHSKTRCNIIQVDLDCHHEQLKAEMNALKAEHAWKQALSEQQHQLQLYKVMEHGAAMKYLMNVEFAKAVQAGKVWQDLWQGGSDTLAEVLAEKKDLLAQRDGLLAQRDDLLGRNAWLQQAVEFFVQAAPAAAEAFKQRLAANA